MRDPRSSPPSYVTPLGGKAERRIYLVDAGLSDEELEPVDSSDGPTSSSFEYFIDELPTVDEGLRELRARARAEDVDAANDQGESKLDLVLFVSASHVSMRMRHRLQRIADALGPRRASLRVVEVGTENAEREVVESRVTFTPTLLIGTNDASSRIVGEATLPQLLDRLPAFSGALQHLLADE